jgi:hypothetical protein
MIKGGGAQRIVFALHTLACVALVGLAFSISTARPRAQPALPNLIVRADVLSRQWVVRMKKSERSAVLKKETSHLVSTASYASRS